MRMNQRILAALLALLLALTLFGATLAEGDATATPDWGINYIERKGIGFSLDDAMKLRSKDILETKISSQLTMTFGTASIVMNEQSVAKVLDVDVPSVELESGEMFVNVPADQTVEFTFYNRTFTATDCAFELDVRTGSATLNLLKGTVSADGQTVNGGQTLSYSGETPTVYELSLTALNDFVLNQAMALADGTELFATADAIEAVVLARADEQAAILQEKLAHEQQVLEQGGTQQYVENTTSGSENTSGLTCTIQIRCDTILDNMENLTEGKNAYVPANGVILATSTIGFAEGETVFEVLKRACSAAGIQLEYSWTPMYGSYYIEGINHLYEFDCGNESGWMYKVNGWFPNYGCSSYTLKDGDVIVWCYTCNGLGADVGGGVY